MSPDLQEIFARLLALETVLGHLVSHMAVRDDDPQRWLATRKVLALHAAGSVERDSGINGLAQAMSDAIAAFFEEAEYAVCNSPAAERTPH
jgi:hypothetical protein